MTAYELSPTCNTIPEPYISEHCPEPLATHIPDLLHDAAALIAENGPSEAHGYGSPWNIISRLGKQQPVFIAEYTTSEGAVPLVVRPTLQSFRRYYTEHETVRQYFPRLYAGIEIPYYGDTSRDVLITERLEGEHGDSRDGKERDAYWQRVKTPEGFEQLCSDMFRAIDEILELPITIQDTRPATGHNVFYNANTGRFQLFDVDTLNESSSSHMEKFLHLIDPGQVINDDTEIRFTMRMLRTYQDKYGATDFAHHDPDVSHSCTYEVAESPTEDATSQLVRHGDADYDGAMIGVFGWLEYLAMIGADTDDLPVLQRSVNYGVSMVQLHPDILGAVDQDDTEAMKAALHKTYGQLTQQTFHRTHTAA